MKDLYHSLLLIAGSTQKELASQIRYLKIENEILRSKLPKRISVTEKERNKLTRLTCCTGRAGAVTMVASMNLHRFQTRGKWETSIGTATFGSNTGNDTCDC